MFDTICDFFVIGHPLGADMNEWVEVVVKAKWAPGGHIELHLGQRQI